MSNLDLVPLNALIEAIGSENRSVGAIAIASFQLVENLTKAAPDQRPQEILTGIPDADLALAQAAGVAQIAGVHGVDMGDVLAFTKLLLGLGLAFVA